MNNNNDTNNTKEYQENVFNTKGYKLTPKQLKFCHEYIANNGNATQAAIKAYHYQNKSYTLAATTGHDNLKKPAIRAYLSDKGERAGAIIMELAEAEEQKGSVRLDAAKFVYEQVYGKASQKTEVVHSGVVSLAGLYSKASPTTLREKNSTGESQLAPFGDIVEAQVIDTVE